MWFRILALQLRKFLAVFSKSHLILGVLNSLSIRSFLYILYNESIWIFLYFVGVDIKFDVFIPNKYRILILLVKARSYIRFGCGHCSWLLCFQHFLNLFSVGIFIVFGYLAETSLDIGRNLVFLNSCAPSSLNENILPNFGWFEVLYFLLIGLMPPRSRTCSPFRKLIMFIGQLWSRRVLRWSCDGGTTTIKSLVSIYDVRLQSFHQKLFLYK